MDIHPHWSNAYDRQIIKKIYQQVNLYFGENKAAILDIGVADYNYDCNKFISNEHIDYWQLEPHRRCANNDGFFNCTVQECVNKHPEARGRFDLILDFGVLGWSAIKFNHTEQEMYIHNILDLLSTNGIYILHGDREQKNPEYIINIEKFLLPKFEYVSIMGFDPIETLTCPKHNTTWDIHFFKKKP
jgi:hypothetical protein